MSTLAIAFAIMGNAYWQTADRGAGTAFFVAAILVAQISYFTK